jgi:hypothetical protein
MLTTGITEATWRDTSRRTWATLTSFAVQTMGLGILVLLPLIYTQGLPQLKLLTDSGSSSGRTACARADARIKTTNQHDGRSNR